MENPEFQKMRESAWRKPLSPEDQARLDQWTASHPDAREDFELERRLTRSLARLPHAPVSSNFTARVLKEATRSPVPKRGWLSRLQIPRWIPRLAMGTLLLALGLFSVQQYHDAQQAKTARQLVSVGQLATLPKADWLDNFETIDRMSQVQVADADLLSSLQ
jgi:anti-sigma factor RsiW